MGLTFVGAEGAAAQSVVNQQQQELHEEGEMRSYSGRSNTVTMHSDLIQVIVII